ncbi:MAG: pyruvate kinase [Candidatus Cyclobacteriaceae bacterium M2_1C_046]
MNDQHIFPLQPGRPNAPENLKLKLLEIRNSMKESEEKFSGLLGQVHPQHLNSARNFIHYLTLRSFDIRELQSELHLLGLSSLASSESHTFSQLNQVLSWMNERPDKINSCTYKDAIGIKARNLKNLFGAFPEKTPHIMVTLSSEMLATSGYFENMLEAGLTIARINCAHDNEDVWQKMIDGLKKAMIKTGRSSKIYMDLPGPKIRIDSLSTIVKGKPGILLQEGSRILLTSLSKKGTSNLPEVYIDPPEILSLIRKDEHIFFDDGKFEARAIKCADEEVIVEVVRISTKKPVLKAGKGINLPHTDLNFSALTPTDRKFLPFICQNADLIGYSFVSSIQDIEELRVLIKQCCKKSQPAIILKIERLKAINNLPSLLLNGLKDSSVGVMIARGDLAVEIGYERLSEIQEQILWICEAAHIPVVWATQVLESMNKTSYATRSEISDAAQSIKAECVMLNKGKYIVKTIKMLSNILKLQQEHKIKKRYTLRPLKIAQNFILS